jgi:hypothetical protein
VALIPADSPQILARLCAYLNVSLMDTTRRTACRLLAAAAVIGASGVTATAKETDMMRSILEASQSEKKGVNLYVKGQAIPGVVTKIDESVVELRSREFSRIVVRIESIDAAAMA